MNDRYNKLCESQEERLALLIEECSETIQAATKVLRHGYESHDPTETPLTRTSNREQLQKEIGHVLFAMTLLCRQADLDYVTIVGEKVLKEQTIGRWLHHNEGG